MSSRRRSVTEKVPPSDWLAVHRQQFLSSLAAQGYSRGTLRTYGDAASAFCSEVLRHRLLPGQLSDRALVKARAAAIDQMRANKPVYKRFCLDRFIDALVVADAAERPAPLRRVPTALARLRSEFETYMREQRGLAEKTIYASLSFYDRFMVFRFGGKLGTLDHITPTDIVAFLREVRGRKATYRDTTPPTHLRCLFRYLFWSGKTKRDLASSLPRVSSPKASLLPRSLPPEEIERLIDATRSADAVGRRNYAMMLLLARLGLRAPEVIAIELGDIDWRSGTILIRGKGKRHDRMPLPEDAGKAIVDYLRNGRRGTSRKMFVSSKVPFPPFVDATILNVVLREAFKSTGLEPPQRYIGSHLMRHSLATDMLRKGASLDEIGDVLRHRSRAATGIYARHDIDGLRSIAQPWPVERGCA
jgi:integrase/recombinase XerD